MGGCNNCTKTEVELVHKQVIPVPAKSLYEDAISRGKFIGTFDEFLEYMRGSIGVSDETGNWVINGEDTGFYAGKIILAPINEDDYFDTV